jgi:protein TonB
MFAPLLLFALALQTSAPTTPSGGAISQPTAQVSDSADPDANGVYHHIGRIRGVTMPQVTHRVEPEFTKEARKRRITATSIVALIVDANGIPQNIHIVQSAAESEKKPKDKAAAATLDTKALEAVQQYRFTPATKDGQPVPVELRVEVNFQVF